MGRNFFGFVLPVAILIQLILVSMVMSDKGSGMGETEAGLFTVGFKTVELYDYSRTYRSSRDYFGNPREGNTARPLQICIWYPAQKNLEAVKMPYSEYVFPYPEDEEFFPFLSQVQNREVNFLIGVMGANPGQLVNYNNSLSEVSRGAPAAEGSFPLLLYINNPGRGIPENAAMLEYLASHGYIVAATHSVGTRTLDPAINTKDLETQRRDLDFVFGRLLDYPGVDDKKIGILGYGYGGLNALLIAMYNGNIGAAAALGDSPLTDDNKRLLRQAPYTEFSEMRVPFLHLSRGQDEALLASVFDSLRFCPRCSCDPVEGQIVSFTQYGILHHNAISDSTQSLTDLSTDYSAVCHKVLSFFDNVFKYSGDLNKLAASPTPDSEIPAHFKCTVSQPDEIPPRADEFIDILMNHGVAKAVELNQKFNLMSPENPLLEGPLITALGYQFLTRQQIPEAVQIFELGVQAYPYSANAWDSYAESYLILGDNDKALLYYRKALETLPLDSSITDSFRETVRNSATRAIEGLEQQGIN